MCLGAEFITTMAGFYTRSVLVSKVQSLIDHAKENLNLFGDHAFKRRMIDLISLLHPYKTFDELWEFYWDIAELYTPMNFDLVQTAMHESMKESFIDYAEDQLVCEFPNVKQGDKVHDDSMTIATGTSEMHEVKSDLVKDDAKLLPLVGEGDAPMLLNTHDKSSLELNRLHFLFEFLATIHMDNILMAALISSNVITYNLIMAVKDHMAIKGIVRSVWMVAWDLEDGKT